MKKIVLLALVAMFTMSFALEAQNNRAGNRPVQGWNAKDRAEALAKEVKLTAAEKTKVLALFEKQDAKRAEQIAQQRESRDGQSQDRANRREEMRAQREKEQAANDAELEKIIGKEKMEQWKKYRENRMRELRNAGGQGRGQNR